MSDGNEPVPLTPLLREQSVQEFDDLLSTVQGLLHQYLAETVEKDAPVLESAAMDPQQLLRLLALDLPEKAQGKVGILPLIEKTLRYSARTWSPRFMDKLYAGTHPIGAIAELIAAVLNTNVHVYHVSPVFTLMEVTLMEKLARMVGYTDGLGVLCPGGSYSNLTAIITARNLIFPHLKQGLMAEAPSPQELVTELSRGYPFHEHQGPLVLFTSHHAHYSIQKSGMVAGLGLQHIRTVAVDHAGRMDPEALGEAIRQSLAKQERPFAVCCTAGTTVLGAFDPLPAISALCRRYHLWMHVDGSWGGSALFSDRLRGQLLAGIEEADSFTLNPHKMLGVPLLCSALIMKQKLSLVEANRVQANYLFHSDVPQGLDLGDGTLGCGRRPDAFKFLLSWMYYGRQGFGRRVELAMERAAWLRMRLGERQASLKEGQGAWELVVGDCDFVNVCFYHYPALSPTYSAQTTLDFYRQLRRTDMHRFIQEMEQITRGMHRELVRRGRFMVDYSPLEMPWWFEVGQVDRGTPRGLNETGWQRLPSFWRVILNHPTITLDDLNGLLDEIEVIGKSLKCESNRKLLETVEGISIKEGFDR